MSNEPTAQPAQEPQIHVQGKVYDLPSDGTFTGHEWALLKQAPLKLTAGDLESFLETYDILVMYGLVAIAKRRCGETVDIDAICKLTVDDFKIVGVEDDAKQEEATTDGPPLAAGGQAAGEDKPEA